MMESLAFAELGPWGLVSVFVVLVAFGGLIPRWIFNRWMVDKDKLIEKLQKALDKRDEQFNDLVQQNTLIIKLLEEIKKAAMEKQAL